MSGRTALIEAKSTPSRSATPLRVILQEDVATPGEVEHDIPARSTSP
jgi:hypothetical protein